MTAPGIEPARRGDWIATYSGGQFWPLDPRPDEISLIDIAHALAMKCRYNGHCRSFYSVAEHSVHVSRIAAALAPEGERREIAAWGLLHDATETWLPDVPSPIKPDLTGFGLIEGRVADAVARRFGLVPAEPLLVKAVDKRLIADEGRALFRPVPAWVARHRPFGVVIQALAPAAARALFLREAFKLGLS